MAVANLQADLDARFPDWGFAIRLEDNHAMLNVLGRSRHETSDDDVEAMREILLRHVESADIGWPVVVMGAGGTPFGEWLADRGFNTD